MDFQSLIKDRRFQLAAGATAAVGGYVWYQRRKAGGSSSTAAGSSSTTAGYPSSGGVDTTGTDVANWLGQYSGSLQNQLDAYAQSLNDAVTSLGQVPTSGSTSTGGTTDQGTGGTVSNPSTPPPAPPPPPSRPYVTVAKYTSTNTPWNSTLSGIAAHTGISLSHLEALNPQISNPNLIYTGQKVYTG